MNEFNYFYNEYMMYCNSKGLTKKTIKSYEQTLFLYFRFVQEELKHESPIDVKAKDFRGYVNYLQDRGKYTVVASVESKIKNNPEGRGDYSKKISNATINNYIRNIKVFYNWLVFEEEIHKNPIEKVKYLSAPRKPKETIAQDDFVTLLKLFDLTKFNEYRNYIITELLLDTGMRVGECLSIVIDDVDFLHNAISLKANIKYDKPRFVYFGSRVKKDLKKWITYKDRYMENDLLFITNRNTQLTVSGYEKQLRDTSMKMGKLINPHQLRNNFAKNYLLNGGDIHSLAKILGHSSVTVTEKSYLDFTNQEIRQQHMKYSPLKSWNMR